MEEETPSLELSGVAQVQSSWQKCWRLDKPFHRTVSKLYISMSNRVKSIYAAEYKKSPKGSQAHTALAINENKKCWKKTSASTWNGTTYSFLTVVICRSASREHKLLGMLRGRQVPQSGPLPGLVGLVRVFSYLCCRLAAGQIGNYIYSNDQNGWDSLSAWHCWWYGWVVFLCLATRNLFIHQLTNTNLINWSETITLKLC